jgi:hypothetical protein
MYVYICTFDTKLRLKPTGSNECDIIFKANGEIDLKPKKIVFQDIVLTI